MKKIYFAAGAIVLSIAGLFAGKSNQNSGSGMSLYYSAPGGVCRFIAGSFSSFSITTSGSGIQMAIMTANTGNVVSIFATSNCSNSPVYFKP
jgi:hypothetical protein